MATMWKHKLSWVLLKITNNNFPHTILVSGVHKHVISWKYFKHKQVHVICENPTCKVCVLFWTKFVDTSSKFCTSVKCAQFCVVFLFCAQLCVVFRFCMTNSRCLPSGGGIGPGGSRVQATGPPIIGLGTRQLKLLVIPAKYWDPLTRNYLIPCSR